MGLAVVHGGICKCSFGAAPAPLKFLPINMAMMSNQPMATIMDKIPMLNVGPFGVCMSLANPMVAAATAAALGVLTPMPCIPMLPAPWIPGQFKAMIKNKPLLDQGAKLVCAYGGMINILMPGEFQLNVG